MGGYNFKRKSDIQSVIKMVRAGTPQKRTPSNIQRLVLDAFSIIAKTPSGGIPAASGGVAGSAACVVYYIDENATLTVLADPDGGDFSIDVYHVFDGDAVAGDTWIQAKRISGRWVVDSAACP